MGEEKLNGEVNINNEQEDDTYSSTTTTQDKQQQQQQPRDVEFEGGEEVESLYGAVVGLFKPILFPDPNNPSSSIFQRSKDSVRENLPHVRDASRSTGFKVLQWARCGSPLRLLLVISVGTITLLTLSGILVFLLFLAAATINAIVISIFVSLAAAGGFLAIFFACLAAIYVGALSVAVFVISSVTIAATIATLIVTGWIGFFWILWLVTSKSFGVAKHSVTVTGSALSTYTSAWHARDRHHHHD